MTPALAAAPASIPTHGLAPRPRAAALRARFRSSRSRLARVVPRPRSPPRVAPIAPAAQEGVGGVFDRLRAKAAETLTRAMAPSASGALVDVAFADVAPSWAVLAERVASLKLELGEPLAPDLENGPANPHALIRRFGTDAEPRVLFYRDHAAWCPYCEKIWLQLEEKRIPYRVEKINMRCYGDKPPSFTAKVPSGMLPVVEIDGELFTDSALIAHKLEELFPDHPPLRPAVSDPARVRHDELLRLERALFSRWMGWLTRGSGDAQNRAAFEEALDVVEAELAATASAGPYFAGAELTLVDITFVPFLERMAASLAYYKGFEMEGGGALGARPNLDAWFRAMENRADTYAGIKSDYYTHAHDLPPQLGGCEANGTEAQRALMGRVDGTDGVAWRLPLPPLGPETSPEPSWRRSDPSELPEDADAEETEEKLARIDRLRAASRLVENHEAVVRFAARGCGKAGRRPVAAPLADPTATPGEAYVPAVDAALRRVAHELLDGDAHARGGEGRDVGVGREDAELPAGPAADALAYLRDRVGVPRDLPRPAARQLRAHLNWHIEGLEEGGNKE